MEGYVRRRAETRAECNEVFSTLPKIFVQEMMA